MDHRGVLERLAGPTGWHEQEVACGGAGGAAADVGEVVGPSVDELKQVVAPRRVGHVRMQRADTQIQLRHRVHGVVVDRDEPVPRPSQLSSVAGTRTNRPRPPAARSAPAAPLPPAHSTTGSTAPAPVRRHEGCEASSDVSAAVCADATASRSVRWMLWAPISSSVPVLRIRSMCSLPTFTRSILMFLPRSS
jgi:hypothetical protein